MPGKQGETGGDEAVVIGKRYARLSRPYGKTANLELLGFFLEDSSE